MGTSAQDRAGDGQAAGDSGAQGGGEGAGRDTSKFVIRPEWVPGSSYRLLPDGSVVRWVTNEGVLLDYAVRLRGAVEDIKRLLDEPDADLAVSGVILDGIIRRWGV